MHLFSADALAETAVKVRKRPAMMALDNNSHFGSFTQIESNVCINKSISKLSNSPFMGQASSIYYSADNVGGYQVSMAA